MEPKRILLVCGDAGIELKQMRWNRWNTAKAKGKGKVTIQICDPSCAEGPKNYRAT